MTDPDPFALPFAFVMALPRVGFWRSEQEPELPDPRDFVDPDWDVEERHNTIAYVEESYAPGYACAGASWCRFGCESPPDIGTNGLTDGYWLFPEGLAHYLRDHEVKPPEEFLEHLRGRAFRVPTMPILERLEPGVYRIWKTPVEQVDVDFNRMRLLIRERPDGWREGDPWPGRTYTLEQDPPGCWSYAITRLDLDAEIERMRRQADTFRDHESIVSDTTRRIADLSNESSGRREFTGLRKAVIQAAHDDFQAEG